MPKGTVITDMNYTKKLANLLTTSLGTLLVLCLVASGCQRENSNDTSDTSQEETQEQAQGVTGEAPATDNSKTTIYVVRHAEKASDAENPDLTEAGALRASALIEQLHGVMTDKARSFVMTSPYNRTRQTCAPTADAKGLLLQEIDAEPEALLSYLQELPAGSHALVCGHSNTVPAILAGLGVEGPPTLEDDDYGDLFVVTLGDSGATMERRRFGD